MMVPNDDALEDRVYFAELFDLYAPILSEKQRGVCARIFDDLSPSEIAGESGVSRQGVHDLVRRTRSFLDDAERSLGVRRMTVAIDEISSIIDRYRTSLPEGFVRECEGVINNVRGA